MTVIWIVSTFWFMNNADRDNCFSENCAFYFILWKLYLNFEKENRFENNVVTYLFFIVLIDDRRKTSQNAQQVN